VTATRPTSGDLAEAHGLFLDEPAAGRIRHKSQAPLRPTAVSSATRVSTWGRLRAATLRLLTVNHGHQRTVGTAAQQPYRT
jgi:hypothetical protein